METLLIQPFSRGYKKYESSYRRNIWTTCSTFEFSTVEEVIELANDTIFGLASYFYAKDLSRVYEVAEAGIWYCRSKYWYNLNGIGPFGGVKQSGLGREGSHYGIDDFLEMKYVCLSV